jgi:divalent metal cation (Fe/Co/Zn/Cd) transporter
MAQNDYINTVLKSLKTLSAEGEQEEADAAWSVKLAVNVSFGANIVLAILQLYAAISSLSLALFASCIDAVCMSSEIYLTIVDPAANLILWMAHRASNRAEEKIWPVRGSRFETIGNVVYGYIMGGVNVILIVGSKLRITEDR